MRGLRHMASGAVATLVVVAVVVLVDWGGGAGTASGDNPVAPADNPVALAKPAATTSPTAAPPTTVVHLSNPVAVPASYAPEPVVHIGTIDIPRLGLHADIFQGITLNNIDHGPSHWPGTAWPGQPGNAVFAGHRVTHTHPFLHIDQLQSGDQVVFNVTVPGSMTVTVSTYAVTSTEVVPPSDLAIVNQTATPTATLFACHPPHSAAFRYVAHLRLVSVV